MSVERFSDQAKEQVRERLRQGRAGRGHLVQAVDRALSVLEVLGSSGDRNLGVTRMARELGVSKSTAYRLLAALAKHDLVVQDQRTRKYRLGWGLYRLAHQVLDRSEVYQAARPFLERFGRRNSTYVNLAAREGTELILLESFAPNNGLMVQNSLGLREPLYCTGLGKALLSDFSLEGLRTLFTGIVFRRLTEHTITSVEDLHADIVRGRDRGYALDDEEYLSEIRCVACPVRDRTGDVVAAVSTSGPAEEYQTERLSGYAARLRVLAIDISRALGFTGTDLFPPPA